MKVSLLNGANLAYIGDAYYELEIRKYLLTKNITNQKKLHTLATNFVSAEGHEKIMKYLFDMLTEEEVSIYKRGRNQSVGNTRKNLNQAAYLVSSGFEAIIGYLYLINNKSRLDEIIGLAIKIIEETYE